LFVRLFAGDWRTVMKCPCCGEETCVHAPPPEDPTPHMLAWALEKAKSAQDWAPEMTIIARESCSQECFPKVLNLWQVGDRIMLESGVRDTWYFQYELKEERLIDWKW
jgi:hypothetical protein